MRPQASEPTAFRRNPIHGMRRRNLGAARDECGSASSAHFVPSQELTGRWPQGCPARAPRPRVPQVFPRFETAALSSTPRRQRTAATMHRARREHGFSCGVLRPWNLMKIAVHASGDAHAPPDGMASDSEMRDMSRSPSRYVIAVCQLNVIAAWEEHSKNYKYVLAAKRRRIVDWFYQLSLLYRADISSCRHPIEKSNPKLSLSLLNVTHKMRLNLATILGLALGLCSVAHAFDAVLTVSSGSGPPCMEQKPLTLLLFFAISPDLRPGDAIVRHRPSSRQGPVLFQQGKIDTHFFLVAAVCSRACRRKAAKMSV